MYICDINIDFFLCFYDFFVEILELPRQYGIVLLFTLILENYFLKLNRIIVETDVKAMPLRHIGMTTHVCLVWYRHFNE